MMMKLRGLAIVWLIETQTLTSPSLSFTVTLSSVNPSFTTAHYPVRCVFAWVCVCAYICVGEWICTSFGLESEWFEGNLLSGTQAHSYVDALSRTNASYMRYGPANYSWLCMYVCMYTCFNKYRWWMNVCTKYTLLQVQYAYHHHPV